MTKAFASNEEFFGAVRAFADQLDAEGRTSAAAEVRDGFSCLNGLTDGWTLFGESLQNVQTHHGAGLTTKQRTELDEFIRTVNDVVHRR